jgi:hypothetical protein
MIYRVKRIRRISSPDLALIETYLSDDLARQENRCIPLENKKREIHVYTKINEKKMTANFWLVMLKGK